MRCALRVADNGPLSRALREGHDVIPFVCARDIGDGTPQTPRGRFLSGAAADLDGRLRRMGSRLFLVSGDPLEAIPRAASAVHAEALFVAAQDDPASQRGDARLAGALGSVRCAFVSVADSVILGKDDLLSSAGTPYTVFTPYRNAWLSKVETVPPPFPVRIRPPSPRLPGGVLSPLRGVRPGDVPVGETAARRRLREFVRAGIFSYESRRDIPGLDGTSRLSAHIAHGTISVRAVLRAAVDARRASETGPERRSADRFIGELIWREFYHQILGHFPSVGAGPFRMKYAAVEWSRNRSHFEAWCEGMTGYPVVDAGMRQLASEGWMHNRVRMIAASFLTKDLHIDWRWGERFFMKHLIDGDVASNNGGWQWSAGTGTDAAPYFRVFNPVAQGKRFDPEGVYVRRYLPALRNVPAPFLHAPWEMSPALAREHSFRVGRDYPLPIVDHAVERNVALDLYSGRSRR